MSKSLPSSWSMAEFADVFDQVSTAGKNVKTKELNPTGRIPVVDQGRTFISGYLNDDSLAVSSGLPLVLFGDHTREVKWLDFSFIPGADGVKLLKPKSGIDARFLYFFLRNLPIENRGYARHFKAVKEATYPLPPLAEQTRIAAKLDELLAQVDTLKARIDGIPALLKRFRQSVLAKAVSGRLTEAWRTRCFPGSISRTKGGWQEIPIENLCKDEKYSLAIGPFGSNLKVTDYRLKGKPLVFVREIRAEKFGDEKTKFITPKKFSELKPHQVFAGDILITKMGGPPGDVAVYPDNAPDAVLTADCIKVSINESLATREFTYFQMKSDLFRTRVKAISAGVAQQKVSLGNFRKLKLWVPPLDEQTEIVRRVEQLFAFADQLEARVAAAQERIDKLTQSILAKAFRGELVAQDPNDEPASVLLERIKAQRAAAPKTKRERKAKA